MKIRKFETFTNVNVSIGDIYETSDVVKHVISLKTGGNLDVSIKHNEYIVDEIKMSDIQTDEYYLDEDLIEDYKYDYEYNNMGIYPLIVVEKLENSEYMILDGNHQANALKDLDIKKIFCLVAHR